MAFWGSALHSVQTPLGKQDVSWKVVSPQYSLPMSSICQFPHGSPHKFSSDSTLVMQNVSFKDGFRNVQVDRVEYIIWHLPPGPRMVFQMLPT